MSAIKEHHASTFASVKVDDIESTNVEDIEPPIVRINTLGSVRHRDEKTKEMILIPTPSSDPNDPLNWSQAYKHYMAFVICLAMFTCNFVAAGPTIAIVATAQEFFPNAGANGLAHAIAQTAYLYTTTGLLQGTGNVIWVPLAAKYGKRPIYIASYTLYFVCIVWSSFTYSYPSFLAARILMGFGSGAAETIAPMSISDVFFLHERGAVMAMYTAALSVGVAGGIVISALILIDLNWRYIYYLSIGLVGLLLLLAIFTFPETSYTRVLDPSQPERRLSSIVDDQDLATEKRTEVTQETAIQNIRPKKSYRQKLALYSGTYTEESLWTLFIRPFGLILLPPVLWATLCLSVTIGFLVAVTSNVAPAFESAYGFQPWKTGLTFIAAIIGSILGIWAGGHFGDFTADFLTKRNGGIREPEMRLPAVSVSLITMPLALILFGVGVDNRLHWICPTMGLALVNFSITQATNIALVYCIDAYRPIVGEVALTITGFKSAVGFLLSFYTNPWIAKIGYSAAYGSMAAIAGTVLLCWIPLYIWGKQIRHATWKWRVCSFIRWDEDREVGE